MTSTVSRSYETAADAQTAVMRLEAAGVSPDDVSIIGYYAGETAEGAAGGAQIGGGIGGVAGLVAGLASLPVPGIGPVVAAGWVFGTLAAGATAGAAAGSLIGSMTSAGLSDQDANFLAETVRRGGAVVAVRTTDSHVPTIEKIMNGAEPIDTELRRAEYERGGWTRFDEASGPYAPPTWSDVT
ncbi:hypothetical protein ASE63_22925 [Bosea sp. Root381]|uniref:hypothetical protein n=1 Tax=Bosea sp. Root381 TaxID=1736524 RepID=UPI0006F2A067|nr:hypothetical protein [Bosea sp. Root381]KRE07551.1 hypothetical protein ASE63_22925 [Bosea sp. Root381]